MTAPPRPSRAPAGHAAPTLLAVAILLALAPGAAAVAATQGPANRPGLPARSTLVHVVEHEDVVDEAPDEDTASSNDAGSSLPAPLTGTPRFEPGADPLLGVLAPRPALIDLPPPSC
jgi:hypothetical protein